MNSVRRRPEEEGEATVSLKGNKVRRTLLKEEEAEGGQEKTNNK